MKARITLGTAGALIVLVVSLLAFGGTPGAGANTGDAIKAGQDNTEDAATRIANTNSFTGCSFDFREAFVACGSTGVVGEGQTNGVYGNGTDVGVLGGGLTGVRGDGSNYGLYGTTSSVSTPAIYGTNSAGGDAVQGVTAGPQASAVYGHNTSGGGSVAKGVFGASTGGGTGVRGESASGHGVEGVSTTGTGVFASGPMGLQVNGKTQFSRSGVATVAGSSTTPKNSVQVHLPITAKSIMTATLQKYVPGVFVVAAQPNVTGGYFTIYLNKSVTTSLGPIAWLVIEKP